MYQLSESSIFNYTKNVYENKEKFNKLKNDKKINQYSSLAKATSDLVAVFPVLCTDTIKMDTASMITKCTERKGTSIIQLALAANNLNSASNGIEYLGQFHKNITSSKLSVDEWIGLMNKVSKEMMNVKEGAIISDEIMMERTAALEFVEWLKDNTFVLPDSINENALSNFKIKESKDSSYRVVFTKLNEDGLPDDRDIKYMPGYTGSLKDKENYVFWKQLGYRRDDRSDSLYKSDKERYNAMMNDKINRSKIRQQDSDTSSKIAGLLSKQLIDTDVKKANELVPTLMIVRFTNTETGIVTSFIIGIKARLIPCTSYEIIKKISSKNKDNKGLVQLLRATTGEISFLNDYLLGIEDTKADVLSKHNQGSRIDTWKILERRANKLKRRIQKNKVTNDVSAITTLVVSQPEVETLMKEYNMDLSDEKIVDSIMQDYNLLCFCIVDEALEIAKFMYDDGTGEFETLPFNSLERDNGTDSMYKKVVNLLSKNK